MDKLNHCGVLLCLDRMWPLGALNQASHARAASRAQSWAAKKNCAWDLHRDLVWRTRQIGVVSSLSSVVDYACAYLPSLIVVVPHVCVVSARPIGFVRQYAAIDVRSLCRSHPTLHLMMTIVVVECRHTQPRNGRPQRAEQFNAD